MIRTFLYILSTSLLLAITTQAQVKVKDSIAPKKDTAVHKLAAKAVKPSKDSILYTSSGGLRIGLDISRFILPFFQPYRTDITVQADARLNKRLYGAIEVGYNKTSHSDTNYTYKSNGEYATIGVDYDFLNKTDPKEKNMVYGGIRYGFAHNVYESPEYALHNAYWNSNIPGSYPKTTMTAHWIELLFGLRVEVLKNFFLGWGVREKIMVSNSASDEFQPIVIPGFGSGGKRSQFDLTYSVSYYFPLYKVKIHVPRVKPKKE